MPGLMRFVHNLGWDGVIFDAIGFAAIIFGVVGVFGSWPLSNDQTNYILIGAIGALMGAVVNLTAKRKAEVQELKDELGTTETKLLDYQHEYLPRLVASVSRSTHHITEMFVNWATPRLHARCALAEAVQHDLSWTQDCPSVPSV